MPKRRAEPGLTKTSEPGITRRPGKNATSYRVRLSQTDPATGNRREITKTFATFADARDFKRKTLHELRAGIYQEPCLEPLRTILAHWLETARLADNSRRAYEQAIRLTINPAIGDVALSRLSGRQVQELYNQPQGKSRAIHVQAALNGALELAVREGLILHNVAAGLRVARNDDETHEAPVWTSDELARFLAAVDEHWLADVYHVAVHTGLRLSELIALRWDDITFDMARLFVRRAKTAAGVRRVALDDQTVERLQARLSDQNRRRDALAAAWLGTGHVFDRGDGRPLAPRTVEEVMTRHVARLGLPHMSIHGLRHQHATTLLLAGVPLHVVQRRLGHASAAITATIYGHALPADEHDAAAVFQETMRPNRGQITPLERNTASE